MRADGLRHMMGVAVWLPCGCNAQRNAAADRRRNGEVWPSPCMGRVGSELFSISGPVSGYS